MFLRITLHLSGVRQSGGVRPASEEGVWMIDWEEIIKAETVEELRDAKLWLFKENMRLENEKKELISLQDKFMKERVKFRDEMDALNHRTVIERKRLKEENLFFDKKMAILQDGFKQLDEDRRKFEREKHQHEQRMLTEENNFNTAGSLGGIAEVLFRSAGNPLTLRKRYRDLMKIFHPDNLCGDEELVQLINKEFVHRREQM